MKRLAVMLAFGLSLWIIVIVIAAAATGDSGSNSEIVVSEPFLTEFEASPFTPVPGSGGEVVEPSSIGSRCERTVVEVSDLDGERTNLFSAVANPNADGNIVRLVAASFELEAGDVSAFGVDGPEGGTVLDLSLFRFADAPLEGWTAFEVPPLLGNEYTFSALIHESGTTEGFEEDQEGDLTLLRAGDQWCVDLELRDGETEISGVVVASAE